MGRKQRIDARRHRRPTAQRKNEVFPSQLLAQQVIFQRAERVFASRPENLTKSLPLPCFFEMSLLDQMVEIMKREPYFLGEQRADCRFTAPLESDEHDAQEEPSMRDSSPRYRDTLSWASSKITPKSFPWGSYQFTPSSLRNQVR